MLRTPGPPLDIATADHNGGGGSSDSAARPSSLLGRRRRLGALGAMLALSGLSLVAQPGCGPGGHYSRTLLNDDLDGSTPEDTAGPDLPESGSPGTGGTGGQLIGTGGAASSGSGGAPGSGGNVALGTGGKGSGGTASGGGPFATGGNVNPGTGGAASGGMGTGGAASGGMGTGGAATGGQGTGGSSSGGSGPPYIISVDFSGSQTVMTSTETAGVKAAPHWNNAPGASGALSALVDKEAVPTTATITWTAGGVWRLSWADQPGDTRMMNGYLDPLSAAAPAQVTVSNLPSQITTGRYDVYVYTYQPLASGSRTAHYALGSTTISFPQTAPSASAFTSYSAATQGAPGNYVVFRGVSGSSFTLTATPGSASGTQTRAPVNGIQIVSPTGS